MARNRKYQSAAGRFAPALRAALLCLLLGGSAVGYVFQKNQIHELGQQIKQREVRLEALREADRKLGKQLVTLRSPAFLERRIKELNLGLVQPQQAQILRLVETPPGAKLPHPPPDAEPRAGRNLALK